LDAIIYLTQPPMKQWALQLLSRDGDISEKFVDACMSGVIPQRLNTFWQSGSHARRGEYHMFEFWSADEERILRAAMDVADHMGMELSLENPTPEFVRNFLK
jgi:hypothetical protein